MTKTYCSSKSTVVLCKTEATTAFSRRICYLTQFSNYWGRPDWYWCSHVFILARFVKVIYNCQKNCIFFPAQSSYATMPLVQTKTQRLQQTPTTSPSTCPRSLSPARQHCSTSSSPPLYSVTHCWFWNLHELSSEESYCCQFLQPPSCGLWARSCWSSTSGSTREPWPVD